MATHSSILAWRIPRDRGGRTEATVHGVAKSQTTERPSTQSPPRPPTYSLPVASDPTGSRVWPNSQLKVGVGSFSAGLPLNPIRGKALGRIRPSGAQSPKGRALTRV